MSASKVPTSIPLGRASFAALERVTDPVVRLLYLRNTLEFVQHFEGRQVPPNLRGELDSAYEVRNRLEHPKPWERPLSRDAVVLAAGTFEAVLREAVSKASPQIQSLMAKRSQGTPKQEYRGPPGQKGARKLSNSEARRSLAQLYRVTKGWEQVATEHGCRPSGGLPAIVAPSGDRQTASIANPRPVLIPGQTSLVAISAINDHVARLFLHVATLQFLLYGHIQKPPAEGFEIGDMILRRKKLFKKNYADLLTACSIRNALVHFDGQRTGVTIKDVHFANRSIESGIRIALGMTGRELRAPIQGQLLPEKDIRFAQFAFDATRGLIEHRAPFATNGLSRIEQSYFGRAPKGELRTLAAECTKRLREVVPLVARTLEELPPPSQTASQRVWRAWDALTRLLFDRKKKRPMSRQSTLLEQAQLMEIQLSLAPTKRRIPDWAKKKRRPK